MRLLRLIAVGDIPLWDCLRLNYAPRYHEMTVRVAGKPVQLADAASFIHIYFELFARQVYRFKAASAQPVILDVGANIGLASIYWSRQWPRAELTCFEPDPKLFDLLTWNIAQHGAATATLVNKAVADFNGAAPFRSEGGASGRVSEKEGNKLVQCVRLGPYLDRPIDLLKIDIEGAEADVLADCSSGLKNVRHLFVEYHSFPDTRQRLDEILALIKDCGFRYYVQTEFCPSSPMNNIALNDGMDLQVGIFGVRV
jgi:FkbM family methyltransferase